MSGAPFVYLHNPQCSKSRQGLQWLQDQGVEFAVRKYLDEPLSLDELRILRKKLGLTPEEFLRKGEDAAKGLDLAPMSVLQAMAEHPRLLERPILIGASKAAIGRPTENLATVLGQD